MDYAGGSDGVNAVVLLSYIRKEVKSLQSLGKNFGVVASIDATNLLVQQQCEAMLVTSKAVVAWSKMHWVQFSRRHGPLERIEHA